MHCKCYTEIFSWSSSEYFYYLDFFLCVSMHTGILFCLPSWLPVNPWALSSPLQIFLLCWGCYHQGWPWSQSWLCNSAPLEAKHFHFGKSLVIFSSAKWNYWDNLRGEMLKALSPPPHHCPFLTDNTLEEKVSVETCSAWGVCPIPLPALDKGKGAGSEMYIPVLFLLWKVHILQDNY